MSIPSFHKPLEEFLSSSADFKVLYNSSASNQFVSPITKRICVLDSSFNPPHLGHYALIDESISRTYFSSSHREEKPDERVILLLLSVKNADKKGTNPESFENRLQMMYLMAKDLAKKYPQTQNVSIGLTKHARFVDKSVCILKSVPDNDLRLTFLVGFDTLIRIFNPKYYLPDKISLSLEEFMKHTDIFCLTRNDNLATQTEQQHYLSDLKNGVHEDLPSHWSKNIVLHDNFGEQVGMISSSNVRKSITQNDNWADDVIPEIRDLIISDKFYSNL